MQVGVQFLEALAATLASSDSALTTDPRTGQTILQIPLPSPHLAQRAATALQALAQHLQFQTPPAATRIDAEIPKNDLTGREGEATVEPH